MKANKEKQKERNEMSKNKTMIEGGEYHLLDLQESINGLVDEFHKRIPVDNDEDLQDLWNITIKCCKKYIEVNKQRKEKRDGKM